jgi:hypothetical protein
MRAAVWRWGGKHIADEIGDERAFAVARDDQTVGLQLG